jgi:hypothetical protein
MGGHFLDDTVGLPRGWPLTAVAKACVTATGASDTLIASSVVGSLQWDVSTRRPSSFIRRTRSTPNFDRPAGFRSAKPSPASVRVL